MGHLRPSMDLIASLQECGECPTVPFSNATPGKTTTEIEKPDDMPS